MTKEKVEIVLQAPPGGGSYLRNADGTLTELEPPTKPAETAENNAPKNEGLKNAIATS